MAKDKVEYELIYKNRECAHSGCHFVVTHYMIKKGTSEHQPVWCQKHKSDAWEK